MASAILWSALVGWLLFVAGRSKTPGLIRFLILGLVWVGIFAVALTLPWAKL